MYSALEAFVVFTLAPLVVMSVLLFLSWAVRPLAKEQSAQIECGMVAMGDHRAIGFHYLHYAVLFLVFDLAALYLFILARATITLELVTTISIAFALLSMLIIHTGGAHA